MTNANDPNEHEFERLREFLTLLIDRTRTNELSWEWEEGRALLTLSESRVLVTVRRDHDNDVDISVDALDSGNVVLHINAGYTVFQDLIEVAEGLYQLARSAALNLPSLDDILRELKNEPRLPF